MAMVEQSIWCVWVCFCVFLCVETVAFEWSDIWYMLYAGSPLHYRVWQKPLGISMQNFTHLFSHHLCIQSYQHIISITVLVPSDCSAFKNFVRKPVHKNCSKTTGASLNSALSTQSSWTKRIVFTDEKKFYLNPPVSNQNNRVWAGGWIWEVCTACHGLCWSVFWWQGTTLCWQEH